MKVIIHRWKDLFIFLAYLKTDIQLNKKTNLSLNIVAGAAVFGGVCNISVDLFCSSPLCG